MRASRATSLGQLLILGVHDHGWSSSLEQALRTTQPGGVLLYPGALRSPSQTAELLHKIAGALDSPPFVAIAEEGGSVNPLKAFLPVLPAPRILARRGPAAVRHSGELIGSALRLLGFNLNLAPRLDLSNPDVKPALDTQTLGTDPKHVAGCGRAFIAGLAKHKIHACGKHFPGRSVPEYDENGMPIVEKTMAELWREDLLPYRELVSSLPFVRLSNASYKAYDFDVAQPATMSSRVVHDLLRVKLGYRGVAVADLFELLTEVRQDVMGNQGAGMELRAFILSIKAGCDQQIVPWIPRVAQALLAEMQKELETGALPREHVDETLTRIRAAKKRLKRPSGKLSARTFDRLARACEKFSQQVRAGGGIDS